MGDAMRVRTATPADVPWLLEQVVRFDQFYGARRSLLPPTMDVAEQKLTFLIESHVFLIAEDVDRGPMGFIAGVIVPHFFSDRSTLSEVLWWVDEPFRGSRAGLLLLNAFVAHGRALLLDVIMTLEDVSPVNPETLLRRGFRAKETNYLLEADV